MELPSQAIRRFSILDSSSEEESSPANAGRAGATAFDPTGKLSSSKARENGSAAFSVAALNAVPRSPTSASSPASSSSSSSTSTSSSSDDGLETLLARRRSSTQPKEAGQRTSSPRPSGNDGDPASFAASNQATGAAAPAVASPGEASSSADVSFNLDETPNVRAKEAFSSPLLLVTSSQARTPLRGRSRNATTEGDAKTRSEKRSSTRKRSESDKRGSAAKGAGAVAQAPRAWVPAPTEVTAAGPVPDEDPESTKDEVTDYCLVPKWQRRQKEAGHTTLNSSRPSIYERGMRSRALASKKTEEMRLSLLTNEAKEATFHPKISARARSLKSRSVLHERPPEAVGEEEARIRKRITILENPCGDGVLGLDSKDPKQAGLLPGYPMFSPRISEQSLKIVNRCRSASVGGLPAGERLYRDAFERERVLAECAALLPAEGMTRSRSASTRPRSQREIAQHVESLYNYESRRQEALRFIREQEARQIAERPRKSDDLHVDVDQVVSRLAHPPDATVRKETHRKKIDAGDSFTFTPQVSPATDEVLSLARARGLGAWFDYFTASLHSLPLASREQPPALTGVTAKSMDGEQEEPTLCVEELCMCTGPSAEIAWFVASVLERQQSNLKEEACKEKEGTHAPADAVAVSAVDRRWARCEFIEALTQFELRQAQGSKKERIPIRSHHCAVRGAPAVATPVPQIWRLRPPSVAGSSGAGQASCHGASGYDPELTFKPKVNPRSEMLSKEVRQGHQGPAHERLFGSAKQKQLQERQRELEEAQHRLAEAAAAQERRARNQARWRATHPSVRKTANSDEASPTGLLAFHKTVSPDPASNRAPEGQPSSEDSVKQCAGSQKRREPPAATLDVCPRNAPIGPSCSPPKLSRQTKSSNKNNGNNSSGTKPVLAQQTPPARMRVSQDERLVTDAVPPAVSLVPQGITSRTVVAGAGVNQDTTQVAQAIQALESLLFERPLSPTPLSIDHEPPAVPATSSKEGEHEGASARASLGSTASPDGPKSGHPNRRPVEHPDGSRSAYADLLLACATCRDALTSSASRRENLARDNKRKLAQLGRELYKKQLND